MFYTCGVCLCVVLLNHIKLNTSDLKLKLVMPYKTIASVCMHEFVYSTALTHWIECFYTYISTHTYIGSLLLIKRFGTDLFHCLA